MQLKCHYVYLFIGFMVVLIIVYNNLKCIHNHILQTITAQYLFSKVDIISHVPGEHYGPDHHGGASDLPRSVSCMALGT